MEEPVRIGAGVFAIFVAYSTWQTILPLMLHAINAGFLVLVAFAVVAIAWTASKAWGSRRPGVMAALGLGIWLGLTAGLALSGVLEPSPDHPPPNGALLLVGFVAVFIVAFGPAGNRITCALPAYTLIGFQAFRLFVELVLWGWAQAGVGPEILTFEGRNFDILVGLTAPLMAWIAARKPSKWLIVGWNVAGMAILGLVLVTAIITAPGPLRQIYVEPDSSLVARWPYVWLPALLVPLAYAGHLLSIRQALMAEPDMKPTSWFR